MQLYSTNNKNNRVGLKQAVLKSLADDKGLYLPTEIPPLPQSFLDNLDCFTFQEIAFQVSKNLFGSTIPSWDLWQICENAINFPAPVVKVTESISSLELWHGPSLAFKDFGARYMAQLMSYFTKEEEEKLTILVATSGDTGGAVAAGFLNTPGIEVIILYPSGRVSPLQEKQLTTLGGNIKACEIEGSFDDCQALVKTAFLDPDLQSQYNLSSANSINIARLIPQSFYYFEAMKQLDQSKQNVFCIPSGNFGNLTAGLLAQKMGLPISQFIAATNLNKVVPDYLTSGTYEPQSSIATLSNAMDVGSPSNFTRMQALFEGSHQKMSEVIKGYSYDDAATQSELKKLYNNSNYLADPHGAVGFLAAKEYLKTAQQNTHVTVLETAHPAKFLSTVEESVGVRIPVPDRLSILSSREKVATLISNNYEDFKAHLLGG